MRNKEQQMNFYKFKSNQEKYRAQLKEENAKWQFQNVQSVYEIAKEELYNQHDQYVRYQGYDKNALYKKSLTPKDNHMTINAQTQKPYNRIDQIQKNYKQELRQYEQKLKNRSSKANSQTNIISDSHLDSQSLSYLSSQQPSFSSKGEFTVLQDFNSQNVSSAQMSLKPLQASNNYNQEWQVVSFAPGDKIKMDLKQKCMRIYEFVQELKFIKQGFQSKLKQQKNYFFNQLQEVKKVIFKLNIKHEKQILELSKNSQKLSKQSSIRQSIADNNEKQRQFNELRIYCQQVQQDKMKAEQKYQNTLKKYQQQIEIISQQLQRKLMSQRDNNLYSNQNQSQVCMNCLKLQEDLQNQAFQSDEIEIWKNKLFDQRQKHAKAMHKLEDQLLSFQEEFQYLEKNKLETQKSLKEKEKQIAYRQSEIDYHLNDINKRQRELEIANLLLLKEKEEIERKKQKIADYQFKILRQQRKQKNEFKEKQIMASEYFSKCQKRKILSKQNNQLQRSDSISSRGSRIDINARLKQIQMLKNKSSRNYEDNGASRNSSKDSRYSGLKDFSSSQVISSNRNLKQYGMSPSMHVQREYKRGDNSQTINLSQKLNRLTQTLQSQLRQMN